MGLVKFGVSSFLPLAYSLKKIALLSFLISLVLMLGVFSQDAFAHEVSSYNFDNVRPIIDNSEWMSVLSDDQLITGLSIPGTHDTMADTTEGFPFVKTQGMSLPDQLKAGIRAFDIRARFDGIGAGFFISHGCVSLNDRFKTDVLNVMTTFLALHKSETIIMELQQESESGFTVLGFTFADCDPDDNFQSEMDSLLTPLRESGKILSFDCSSATLPSFQIKLGDGTQDCDARGKIIIINSRWASLEKNTIGSRSDLTSPFSIGFPQLQNDFALCGRDQLDNKWEKVKAQFERALFGADTIIFGQNLFYFNSLSTSLDTDSDCIAEQIFTGFVSPIFAASGHEQDGDDDDREFIRLWSENDSPSEWSPFPRLECTGGDTVFDTCKVFFEGINILAEQCLRGRPLVEDSEYSFEPRHLCDNRNQERGRLGLVYMDFPGQTLIDTIIKSNPGISIVDAQGPYRTPEGTPVQLEGCIRGTLSIVDCDQTDSNYIWIKGTLSNPISVIGIGRTLIFQDVDDNKDVEIALVSFGDTTFFNSDTTEVQIVNVPPTPFLVGSSSLQTRINEFTFFATDPSEADTMAGFTYRIEWWSTIAPSPNITTPGSSPALRSFNQPPSPPSSRKIPMATQTGYHAP